MKPRLKKILRSSARYLLALGLLSGTYFYFNIYHKDVVEKFYVKFDIIGLTTVGRAEQDRLSKIEALYQKGAIRGSESQALTNHTVFFGATTEMVQLALGNPATTPTIDAKGNQIWVYYFDDFNRPTYLYFVNKNNVWVLSSAEKSND